VRVWLQGLFVLRSTRFSTIFGPVFIVAVHLGCLLLLLATGLGLGAIAWAR